MEEDFWVVHALRTPLLELLEHGLAGGLKHTIEATEHREGEDDPPVLGLLEIAPEQIGNGPDERREIGV